MSLLIQNIILICAIAIFFNAGTLNADTNLPDNSHVNKKSVGDVIKYVRDASNADPEGKNRQELAEWITTVVDDRLISSNSREWFNRPVYAWFAVYWTRSNPGYGDDYYDQANVSWSNGYGNCGENSIVVYYILKKAGVKDHVRYIQAGEDRSHSFTVWGMPPDAITQDPSTWGDALVLDPWVGEVLTGPEIKDHTWFQNGDPSVPLNDSSTTVDEEAEDWNTIWREEMVRTGRIGQQQQNTNQTNKVDDLLSDCFIASAAYGTPLNDEIQALRGYRDNNLQSHILGRLFISTYEKIGPVAAYYISNNESRKEWARNHIVEPALTFIDYEK